MKYCPYCACKIQFEKDIEAVCPDCRAKFKVLAVSNGHIVVIVEAGK